MWIKRSIDLWFYLWNWNIALCTTQRYTTNWTICRQLCDMLICRYAVHLPQGLWIVAIADELPNSLASTRARFVILRYSAFKGISLRRCFTRRKLKLNSIALFVFTTLLTTSGQQTIGEFICGKTSDRSTKNSFPWQTVLSHIQSIKISENVTFVDGYRVCALPLYTVNVCF